MVKKKTGNFFRSGYRQGQQAMKQKVLDLMDDYYLVLYKEDEDGDHICCGNEIMAEIMALKVGDTDANYN